MAKQMNFDAFVDEFANDTLKSDLKRWENAGKEAVKQIRESIVDEWFGEFNSSSINEATQYRVYSRFFVDATAKIYIHSYIDIDEYKEKPKAEKWVSKYGGKLDPKEYVLRLQMTEGIIGLPEKATARPDSNWENSNFHKRDVGLRDTIFKSEKWKTFDSLVKSIV